MGVMIVFAYYVIDLSCGQARESYGYHYREEIGLQPQNVLEAV